MKSLAPLALERGIAINVDLTEDRVPIKGDVCSLKRVVDNLVGNAIKFVPSGGSIDIKLEKMDGSEAILKISDTGPGISKEEQNYLFQRFWRGRKTRETISGTGLGLCLCQQIVEAHDGSISCVAEESKGTTFLVRLPLAA